MRKLLFAFIATIFFSTATFAKEPTWEETKKLEMVYLGLSAVDAIQTIDCLNRNVCYEINPIYGRNPSTEKVIGIKVVSGIIHYLIIGELYKMDPKLTRTIQYISIGLQGGVVAANLRFAF